MVATCEFDFSNYQRNRLLDQKGFSAPKTTKTGTTIVGLIYKNGVVLGADTRATSGSIVADKNCEKIHYLAPNMYCCGAGTAADTEMTTNLISSNLEFQRLTYKRPSRIVCAMTMLKQHLFKHQGHIGAALVLGGIDPVTGPTLYSIAPHGSTDKLPYVTMGSGSLAAMAVFEDGYKPDLSREEAIKLVSDAILAGIFNDLGSGSNVDVVVLEKAEKGPSKLDLNPANVEILRNYIKPNERPEKPHSYLYPRGTTVVIEEIVKDLRKSEPSLATNSAVPVMMEE